MNLTVIALDLSAQEECAMVVDQFHDAGLIDNCVIVDLASRGRWQAAWPDELPIELHSALSRQMWSRIVVVSVRGVLSAVHPGQERVHAEEELIRDLTRMYGATLEILGVTLSQFGDMISEAQFPQDYQVNFLHEPVVEVDPGLPLAPLSDTTRSRALMFTAFTIANCGRWATGEVLTKVKAVNLGGSRDVRFVRALSRVGMLPPIVGDTVRVAVRPGGGAIPAHAGVVVPMDSHADLVRKVARQFVAKYGFAARPYEVPEPEQERVHWLKALRDLLVQLPRYLRAAAVAEWQDKISDLTAPFKRRLEDIAFPAGGRFVIDGVAHEGSPDAMARLASELKARLEGFEGVVAPIATPSTWEGLLQTSFGLLDAGDLPAGVDPPNAAGRVLFMNPNVVGPDLGEEFFHLSATDCEVLEYPADAPTSVGMFESFEVDKMREAVSKAAAKASFRAALIEKRRAEEEERVRAKEEAEKESTSRLRGTLSREERIAAKRESATEDVSTKTEAPLRLPDQIMAEFDAWDSRRKLVSGDSLIAMLYETLNRSVETEFERMKWDELMKEAEALLVAPERRGIKWKKLLRFFGILFVVLMVAAFLVSNVFGLILSVVGIPLLLFVGIAWLTSFGFAIVRSVVKRALEMRRWDLKGRWETSVFMHKYHSLIHSINEFRRLELLRMQFADWQRLVRELAHHPYGKLRDAERSLVPLEEEEIPPQLVLAKMMVDPDGDIAFRKYVHQQLKTRGFLSTISATMEELWRVDYERADVGVAPTPRQDTSPPDLKPGKFLEGREYLFPRRDFVTRGSGPELRARMVADNVMTLDSHFRNLTLAEILGSVDAGDLRPAYRRVVPVDFLRGIAVSGRRQFMQEMFDPATAGTLFTDNVDDDVSFRSTDGSKIGDFLLHQDDNGVLLGSTRIDISRKITPDQLRGYAGGSGSGGLTPSAGPERPRV
jgi:hypothetical protein